MEKPNKEIFDDNIRLTITYLERAEEKFIAAVTSKEISRSEKEHLQRQYAEAFNIMIETLASLAAAEIRGFRIVIPTA